jgi:hypothetical protein
MPKRLERIGIFALAMFLSGQAIIVQAQQAPTTTSTTPTVKLEAKEVSTNDPFNLKSLSLTVTQAIIDLAKDVRQTDLQLRWELLPDSLSPVRTILRNTAREGYVLDTIDLKIPNGHLDGKGGWLQDIPEGYRADLADALKTPLEQYSKSNSDEAFLSYWQANSESGGINFVEKRLGIKPSQYYGLLRDHFYLSFLLGSHGLLAGLDIRDPSTREQYAKVLGKYPRIFDSEITWYIKLYKYSFCPISPNGSPEECADLVAKGQRDKYISFYRVAIKALLPTIRLVFQSAGSDVNAELYSEVDFKSSPQTVGLSEVGMASLKISTDATKNPEVLLTDDAKKYVNNYVDQNKRPTGELAASLQILSGATSFGPALGKLLGNSENLSIVTGGLIASGRVEPLVGVNLGFSQGEVNPGVLFGAGLSGRNSFFLGPSLQVSAFTLAAGGTLFESQGRSDFQPAGVISIDLNRLLNGPQTVSMKVDTNSTAASDFAVSSDELSANLTATLVALTNTVDTDAKVELEQVEDQDSKPLGQGLGAKLELKPTGQPKFYFIPRGIYRLKLKDGLKLKTSAFSDGLVNGSVLCSFSSDILTLLNVSVEKSSNPPKPPVSTPSNPPKPPVSTQCKPGQP